jgi:hypothetical protein
MATNQYFRSLTGPNNSNEQDLIHNLTAEVIQIKGHDMVYLPRSLQKVDNLYQEDLISSFSDSFTIEMYIDSVDGFAGEGDLMAKFGFVVKDELNLSVAVRRFVEETGMAKPIEGDLIYFPLSKGVFEIKFVEDEKPFFPAGTLTKFELRCQIFDLTHETFATGNEDIDSINTLAPDIGTDPWSNNDYIQGEGDEITDFTDQNPFGNY